MNGCGIWNKDRNQDWFQWFGTESMLKPLPQKANICGRKEIRSSILKKLNFSYQLEIQVPIWYELSAIDIVWELHATDYVLEVLCMSMRLKTMPTRLPKKVMWIGKRRGTRQSPEHRNLQQLRKAGGWSKVDWNREVSVRRKARSGRVSKTKGRECFKENRIFIRKS